MLYYDPEAKQLINHEPNPIFPPWKYNLPPVPVVQISQCVYLDTSSWGSLMKKGSVYEDGQQYPLCDHIKGIVARLHRRIPFSLRNPKMMCQGIHIEIFAPQEQEGDCISMEEKWGWARG